MTHSSPLGAVRALGNSLRVSPMGLGCMGMSEFYGPSDDTASIDLIHAAQDAGISLFDSADTYGLGHNERLLGKALGTRLAEAVVATKFGIVRKPGYYERSLRSDPAYVRSACEASLKRLGTETIDLYYAHRLNPQVPVEETVGAMADLVKEGKVRPWGCAKSR